MPKKLDWVFVKKLKAENAFNSFMETLPPYATTNNNLVNWKIVRRLLVQQKVIFIWWI